MTEIEQLYEQRRATPSDINQHMETLRWYAERCTAICEFGVRSGNSTVAFLAGLNARDAGYVLHSFDIDTPSFEPPPLIGCAWEFTKADTAQLSDIPECDLLFIDTLHTAAQVEAELKHADRVKRWLVFHDTTLFGTIDEGTREPIGICHAIWRFLASRDGLHWRPFKHYPHNNGLLILERVN